jgi:U4/U6.U5 tri-snRNP-associated protein 1
MADIDLEAANRLRVSMGLKPIPVPSADGPSFKEPEAPDEEAASTLETREAAAGDNWLKLQQEAEAKAKRKEQKEAIRKAREAAQRNVRMVGRTLGDEDEEVDTMTWLKKQHKRQKVIEQRRKEEEEKAARERANRAQYTAKDLAGVKVGHELDQFDNGAEQILTLKDAVIGEESEDDELENLDLREDEKLKKRLELKKKKPVYNPMDDEENGPRGILQQYDEEIDGKKEHRFTLDGQGSTREQAMREAAPKDDPKSIIINLDILKDDKPVSDYIDISEIKIKKPKKKKSKSTRKRDAENDDIFGNGSAEMELDTPAQVSTSSVKKRKFNDTNFVDDDDLQSKLAQQRREALKKKKRIRPEDLAKQLREEEESAMDGVVESTEEAPGLVLDETSEFVQHIQPEEVEERTALKAKPNTRTRSPESDEDKDIDMDQSYANVDDKPTNGTSEHAEKAPTDEVTATGLEEEGSITQGLGATLAMLRQRRLVDEQDSGNLNLSERDREAFIANKRMREEDAERHAKLQRERDRQSGRLDRMSAREREDYARQNNTRREQMESREMAELFNKEYRPNVDIKYIDEFGRRMNEKEAFKHLSHQFHGKGSGKQKHEKRLKKIEEEKKRESMSALDGSQHASSSAMGNKAKRNQQAGVRLQ